MEGDGVVAGGAVSGDADDGGAPAVETQPIGDLVDDAFGFSDARAVAEDEVDAGAGAVVERERGEGVRDGEVGIGGGGDDMVFETAVVAVEETEGGGETVACGGHAGGGAP